MTPDKSIDQLFEQWLAAFERQQVLSVAELCPDQPKHREALSRRIAAWRRLHQSWNTDHAAQQVTADLDDSALTGIDHVKLGVDYCQLQHLASGGIGVVYQATDACLERTVAIKTVRSHVRVSDPSNRFLEEARITAGLDHPGIVPVYGMGTTEDGSTFYVMRLVRGQTMGETIEAFFAGSATTGSPDFESRGFHDLLGRFAAVCKTIAYAHSRGIIHCDIKPRNILFGRFGETVMLDWGAACPVQREEVDQHVGEETLVLNRITDSDSAPTRISGTLPFMSPEQATGSEQLTRATDVFSLGVTLYAILSGKTPYRGESTHEIRQQIIRGDFPTPRNVQRGVSPAIEAICLKAMANQPRDRYASAMDLADDVERFLADETIPWFREPATRRASRWVRRHRQAASVAAISAALLMLSSLAFLFVQANLARREQTARHQGLTTRVALAADSLRYEMDRRIWALQDAARDPQLIQRVRDWNQHPAPAGFDQTLCEWLQQAATPVLGELGSYCWFLNAHDGQGTQIARYPLLNEQNQRFASLGRSYSRREYFHGPTTGSTSASPGEYPPLTQPHITTPFRGTHNEFVVAISVPVLDPDAAGQAIGVIGMAVRLGDMSVVGEAIARGDLLVVANTNTVELSGASGTSANVFRGLIMQHPVFQEISYGTALAAHVPELTANALSSMTGDDTQDRSGQTLLARDYRDPIGDIAAEYQGRWLAAHAMVQRPSRLPADAVLGWVIILQERP